MQLSPQDVEQFFRLHKALMCFVGRRLEVIDEMVTTLEAYTRLPVEVRLKVHKALVENMDLIDAFVDENPFHLDEADLEIVRSWKHLVSGHVLRLPPAPELHGVPVREGAGRRLRRPCPVPTRSRSCSGLTCPGWSRRPCCRSRGRSSTTG